MSGPALTLLLSLAAALTGVGLVGLLRRRTLIFQLLAAELMLAGPMLAFIAAGAHHEDAAGQGMAVMILALAASEAAVGLILILRLRHVHGLDDSDRWRRHD